MPRLRSSEQISYICESVKSVVKKLVETSVENGMDKKAEWTTLANFLYFSVPSTPFLARNTNMTQLNASTPSY